MNCPEQNFTFTAKKKNKKNKTKQNRKTIVLPLQMQ